MDGVFYLSFHLLPISQTWIEESESQDSICILVLKFLRLLARVYFFTCVQHLDVHPKECAIYNINHPYNPMYHPGGDVSVSLGCASIHPEKQACIISILKFKTHPAMLNTPILWSQMHERNSSNYLLPLWLSKLSYIYVIYPIDGSSPPFIEVHIPLMVHII